MQFSEDYQILGNGLMIRDMTLADAPALAKILELPINKFFYPYIHSYQLPPEEAAKKYCQLAEDTRHEGYGKRSDFIRSIFNENGGFCGMTYTGISHETGAVEIGYFLDPQHQGKGIATEATRMHMDWARNHMHMLGLPLDHFHATVRPYYKRSIKILKKVGLVKVDETPDSKYIGIDGKPEGRWIYESKQIDDPKTFREFPRPNPMG